LDSTKNQGETDVDCGGPNCGACTGGKTCIAPSDCDSTICNNGVCQAASCSDGIQNQKETDIDCGGPNCTKCAWARANNGFAGTPCFDGIKYDATGVVNPDAYICTTDNGVNIGTIAAGAVAAWTAPNGGLTNTLQARAIATHPTSLPNIILGVAPVVGQPNYYFSSAAPNNGAAWNSVTTPATTWNDTAGNLREIFAVRVQPMIGNMVGTWDPNGGTPQSVVLIGGGINLLPVVMTTSAPTATGTVRSFAGTGANIFAAVFGEAPDGTPLTGGIYNSTSKGAAGSWNESDTGVAPADVNRVFALASAPTNGTIFYAAIRGPGQLYKSTNTGASWTQMNNGLPAGVDVLSVAVSPLASSTVYVGTANGLYISTDDGATFVSSPGLVGRQVRAIGLKADGSIILIGTSEVNGLYTVAP
jgi:hypothetical protein